MITNFQELQNAVMHEQKNLYVKNNITCYHSIILPADVSIEGEILPDGSYPTLMFTSGDGLGVTSGNEVKNLTILTSPLNKAIYNTIVQKDLGLFSFKNLKLTGQFSFITRTGVMKAKLEVDNLHIVSSDSRKYLEQPQKYGVNALQGALTIYNTSTDVDSMVECSLSNISIGLKNAPVVGSGIFVGGGGDAGGRLSVDKIHTLEVHSTGFIPFGVSDIITAAVFVLNGAKANNVIHDGEIVTYGVNDMVLDAWGEVDTWTCNYPITSYGPSGVGFVNFGTVGTFIANAPLTTYGLGARGYNQYDGTVGNITFDSITTFGNGSVGIQVSKKIGNLTVKKSVTTHGSIGNTLVKGINIELPAYGISIKEGGDVNSISIGENINAFGEGVAGYIVDGGNVKSIDVKGKISK